MDAHQIFEILVRENSQMLTAYLRSVTQDEASIDDIWQETMLVAWRRIGEFDSSRPFGPWLRGIAAKLLLASRRQYAVAAQREVLVDEEAMDYLNHRLHQVQQLKGDTLEEKLEALRECLAHLNDREQECIELRFRDGLMPAQLSERLGVAIETVKKRLVRSKQKLASCLTQKLDVAEGTS